MRQTLPKLDHLIQIGRASTRFGGFEMTSSFFGDFKSHESDFNDLIGILNRILLRRRSYF
jgi:hypothetical protein